MEVRDFAFSGDLDGYGRRGSKDVSITLGFDPRYK